MGDVSVSSGKGMLAWLRLIWCGVFIPLETMHLNILDPALAVLMGGIAYSAMLHPLF